MKVIAPFISCLIEPSDETVDGKSPLDQALEEGYSQIFLQAIDGMYKYHALRPGHGGKPRFICLKVDSIPGLTLPKIAPSIQFLPAGKIPMSLFDEVKEFFRQVITKKGRALEAMIWVLWTQEKGYFLHVPNQTVGHASAVYDWNSLPENATIVVDIHSHADFNAFFSGTDDRDDQNCIRFSGVVGHNDKETRTMKFRFNYLGTRIDVNLEDLFVEVKSPASIPESWFDNVKTSGYQGYQGGHHGGTQPYNGPGWKDGKFVGWQNGATNSSGVGGGGGVVRSVGSPVAGPSTLGGPIHGTQRQIVETEKGGTSKKAMKRLQRQQAQQDKVQARVHRRQQGQATLAHGSFVQDGNGATEEKGGSEHSESRFSEPSRGMVQVGDAALGNLGFVDPNTGEIIYAGDEDNLVYDTAAIGRHAAAMISPQDESLDDQAARHFAEAGGVDEGGDQGVGQMERLADHPEFDSLAINHGVDTAVAFVAIDLAGPQLASTPELLHRSIGDLFQILDEEHQLPAFREMAQHLSKKDQEELATNGL